MRFRINREQALFDPRINTLKLSSWHESASGRFVPQRSTCSHLRSGGAWQQRYSRALRVTAMCDWKCHSVPVARLIRQMR